MSRFTILAIMLIGAITFVVLVVFVNQDHQGAQQDKRNENLRVARLANGLPEEELDEKSPTLPKVMATQTDYEFGFLEEGASFKHSFEIRNEGSALLELSANKPSCDCLTATLVKRALEPGEKTTLELLFKPDGKTGSVMQGVRVATNDPSRKELFFRIIGQTKQVYWVDRSDIAFTDLQPDESREAELNIFSVYDDGFEILNLRCEPASLTAKVEPVSLESLTESTSETKKDAKSAKKLIVTCPLDIRDFTGAKIYFSVKQGASEKILPYEFKVTGSRLGRISVHGNSLDSTGRMKFGQLLVGEGKKAIYAVKVRGAERELKVKSSKTRPLGVLVSVDPVDEKSAETGLYRLIVDIPADLPEQSHMGRNAGMIEIEFENPLHKKFEFQLQFSIVKAKSIE